MHFLRSEDAHAEYSKLKEMELRLRTKNGGMNLLNAEQVNRPKDYYIRVLRVEKLTLVEHFYNIVVKTNLPIGYWGDEQKPFAKFIEELHQFVSIPKFKFHAVWNRKNEHIPYYSWSLTEFRKIDIDFEKIKIEVGKEAQRTINEASFRDEVKRILGQQRDATPEEVRAFERYHFLFQRVDDLERQLKNREQRRFRSGKDTLYDKSTKLSIGIADYNRRLRKVELELIDLKKRFPYLKMPDINYYEMPKQPTIEEFQEEYQQELDDEWNSLDDSEKDEYDGDFGEFCRRKFIDFLDYNDFETPTKVED